jgi:hypothetical protein
LPKYYATAAVHIAAGTASRGDRTVGNPFIRGLALERLSKEMPNDMPKTAANIEAYFAAKGCDEQKRDAGNTTGEITGKTAEQLAKAHHGAETYAYVGVDDRESIRLFAEASRNIDIAARNAAEKQQAAINSGAQGLAADPPVGSRHPEEDRLKVRRSTL